MNQKLGAPVHIFVLIDCHTSGLLLFRQIEATSVPEDGQLSLDKEANFCDRWQDWVYDHGVCKNCAFLSEPIRIEIWFWAPNEFSKRLVLVLKVSIGKQRKPGSVEKLSKENECGNDDGLLSLRFSTDLIHEENGNGFDEYVNSHSYELADLRKANEFVE